MASLTAERQNKIPINPITYLSVFLNLYECSSVDLSNFDFNKLIFIMKEGKKKNIHALFTENWKKWDICWDK